MVNKKSVKKQTVEKKTSPKKDRASAARKNDADIPQEELSEMGLFPAVQKKAYDLYLQRGCVHGDDRLDWYHAEKSVRKQMTRGK
ncbi:MAG: DUF2934 domain-containing protein [Candidatus Omnitrophica bacterium]|nr:DUF2934 domain-containing protein [Candidatus Omnitrophota bacterium]MBU1127904.1 DUF2934 domain-containing protein [Candidatus Omnitrophota bacterium]MBU1784588.1 DUF2934 domain-containing protein [Candidatus Omnitrophota bacterium]MBU1850917.1 DUF2934 domain-containing protein [Candidatus Omnitrophota bacterium]